MLEDLRLWAVLIALTSAAAGAYFPTLLLIVMTIGVFVATLQWYIPNSGGEGGIGAFMLAGGGSIVTLVPMWLIWFIVR